MQEDEDLSGADLTDAEFEEFTREVAARIVQTYWRQYQQRRVRARRRAEQLVMRRYDLICGVVLRYIVQCWCDYSCGGGFGVCLLLLCARRQTHYFMTIASCRHAYVLLRWIRVPATKYCIPMYPLKVRHPVQAVFVKAI